MEKVPMTIEGFKKLESELHRLKVEERPRIIQQISEARDHGDLSENAEYHAAKDAQGMNEAKVAELEDKVSRAEVIDPAKLSGSTVMFGATEAILEVGDTRLVHALLLLGRVIFRVLGEIAVRTRFGDGLNDAWTLLRFEALQLRFQRAEAFHSHRNPFHRHS